MDNSALIIALIILLVLTYFVADIAAGGDMWQIGQQNEVSHRWGARLRGIVFALPCVALAIPRVAVASGSNALVVGQAVGFVCLQMILLWLVLLAAFWIAFDLRINARWGKNWDYIGGTASLDTLSGKFLARFGQPGLAYLIIKILVFIGLLAGFLAVTL